MLGQYLNGSHDKNTCKKSYSHLGCIEDTHVWMLISKSHKCVVDNDITNADDY